MSDCRAAGRGYRGSLDCAPDGSTADQMPIVGKAILRGILAHRRHCDSVAQSGAPDRQRAQQVNLAYLPIVISVGLSRAGSRPYGLVNRSVDYRLTHSICFGLHDYQVVLCCSLVFRRRLLAYNFVKLSTESLQLWRQIQTCLNRPYDPEVN